MNRIKTFIQGFDDRISNGIPEGHCVLIAGEPGAYKSSIAFNILYNQALVEGKKSVYITLEQSRENLVVHMKGMGFDHAKVEELVTIVDLALIRKNLDQLGPQSWMQIFKTYAMNLKESLDYQILVIDSLPVLSMLAEFTNPRQELFHFFEWLRDLKVTTLILGETDATGNYYAKDGEDFLSDGIVHLKMEKVGDVNIQRRIRCVKMRATAHSTDYYTLIFSSGLFQATRVISE